MVSVKRSYAESIFGQIHLRTARPSVRTDQPPLLCLHQSPKSGRDYENLIAHLGKTRPCIAPDTPGYGDSDAPPSQPGIADYGRAMLALIDDQQASGALPSGPIDLIGYHTGSAIAAWLAVHAASRIRRIIFVSLPAFDAATRAHLLENMHAFRTPQADASHIDTLWQLGASLNDPRHSAEWSSIALGEVLRTGNRMPWGFHAVFSHDVIADLKAVQQPSLVLCPQDDLSEQTRAAHLHLANHQFVEWPAGNGFLDLDTADIAKRIEEFLR